MFDQIKTHSIYSFLNQRAIWFKISDIKSKKSQIIMEINDVNIRQYE